MAGSTIRFGRAVLNAVNRLIGSPLKYKQDGLYTVHASDFLNDPRFARAYERGVEPRSLHRTLHIEWRVYVCCWAAQHALKLEGDFVECGVNTAVVSRAVAEYVNFAEEHKRTFYLLDTFAGIPPGQFTEEELRRGFDRRYAYGDTLQLVRQKFEAFDNVRLIPGMIPDSLSDCDATRVAYLSIDMNAVSPEIAAIAHFWPKLVPGGVVVLDDYNWAAHSDQRRAFDEFARSAGTAVLALPTGQGLMVKPTEAVPA